MNSFNFKSQVCTSRPQSERLLALGIKPETADMSSDGWNYPVVSWGMEWSKKVIESGRLPAWSLHRLIEMMPKNIAIDGDTAYPLQIQKRSDGKWCVGYQGWYDCVGDLYDSVIWIYQLLISEGYLDEFCNKG